LSSVAHKFLENLNYFLTSGHEPGQGGLVYEFEQLLKVPRRNSEIVLLRAGRLVLQQLIELSIARLCAQRTIATPQAFVQRLIEDQKLTLLPSQIHVLQNDDFWRSGNSLLTLPTSSGKTLIAEFALVSALRSGPGICFYIVPYIALGNQVVAALRKHVPNGIRIHSLFGGFRAGVSLDPQVLREIVVATPERFDAIVRAVSVFDFTRLIVIDELHLVENGVRGARIECLIGRLLLKQQAGADFRMIYLSAVLPESDQLRGWLQVSASRVFSNPWRPTARRIGMWLQQGSLVWIYGNDPIRPEGKTGFDIIGWKPLPWPLQMYATDKIAQINSQLKPAYRNSAYLANYLAKDIGSPVLVVCATRATSRGVASAIADLLPDLITLASEAQEIVNVIRARAPYLETMVPLIRKGVCFHNASIPPPIRSLIEAAIRTRALNFVASTTTLAEGVDLPFRVVILHDWLRGFGDLQQPLGSLMFRNIAGRCGRAGEFTEGDTIIFDNVLGSLRYTHPSVRQRWQFTLFADPPALKSVISNDNLADDDRRRVEAVIAAQFLGAIPEHPESELLDDMLTEALYASHTGGYELTRSVMQRARQEILDASSGEPFAIAASPIRLTELGRRANLTGLSPGTCRILLAFSRSDMEGRSWQALGAALLLALGTCPEQQNSYLTAIAQGKRSRFFVTRNDLEPLIDGWVKQKPLHELFLALPKAKSSKAAVSPARWIAGEGSSDFVAGQYDKFVDFAEYVLVGFLPWMLRSCAAFGDYGAEWAQYFDWEEVALAIESVQASDMMAVDSAIRGTDADSDR
jgi:helicase